MGFYLFVSRRANQVEKVGSRVNIELKCQVPVSGQLRPRCLDVYGLRIALRSERRRYFVVAEPLDLFLRSFSCSGLQQGNDPSLVEAAVSQA